MSWYTETPNNFYADSSEDEDSGHSSIFQASLCAIEEESTRVLEKGKQPCAVASAAQLDAAIIDTLTDGHDDSGSPVTTRSETRSMLQTEHVGAASTEGAFGTSVDSCSTLVPTADHDAADLTSEGEGARADTEKLGMYSSTLYMYASPKEPTEVPPTLPGPPAQRRADTVAEILFRQDMQTYGLHVSTSTAAMSYFRRSEYHEALRATDFNFRAVQSQQRTYGDLRNHPFYYAVREDSPLLRHSGSNSSSNGYQEERGRQRYQRRDITIGGGNGAGGRNPSDHREPGIWASLWEILCCIATPSDRVASNAAGDWY
ncbi:hypothetical protein DRE_07204 [Drechslerella stenobrocha 248]|uniref:Uncharacterized protein n=1 Tax=Drechslerella stenobrocha 248 TaxID=1043628 RepID=W7HLV3_9PEZI|nr:hypothetical protein DRE_07204 [Drechslerella stenobrocha 248]